MKMFRTNMLAYISFFFILPIYNQYAFVTKIIKHPKPSTLVVAFLGYLLIDLQAYAYFRNTET